MKTMWRITRDLVDPERELAESEDFDQAYKESFQRFRMFADDEDGEDLLFEGEGNCLVTEDGTGFEPLHDFGTLDSGCTTIQWHIEGDRWEVL